MTETSDRTHDGGCTCGATRYRLQSDPMYVHCCHCTWCQRETGAAFAVNAMIESDRVTLTRGSPEMVLTPTASGRGQKIWRCPQCQIALWSNYSGAGDKTHFVRVGTLDEPQSLPPAMHIYTASKQPWMVLSADTPAVEEYYPLSDYWPPESLERRDKNS